MLSKHVERMSIDVITETMMFDGDALGAFLVAATALVIAPGPGQALVVSRSIQGGARAGVLTALGLEIGTLIHTVAAAAGLSAILATSATAFGVVKYLGAAYLIVIGSVALSRAHRAGFASREGNTALPETSGTRLVLHAAITGVLNPKVAVFFLAFLPQFVRTERGGVFYQFLALGMMLATMGGTWDATLATLAGRARSRLLMSRRFAVWRERFTGAVLIGLGLRLAASRRG